jgi:hypothetical protein
MEKNLKLIKNFKIFENLQQAEKYVEEQQNKEIKPSPSFYENSGRTLEQKESNLFYYNKLKEYLTSIGKLGYLYFFTKLLYAHSKYEFCLGRASERYYEKMIEYINIMIKHKIKIEDEEIKKIDYGGDDEFYRYVDKEIRKRYVNNFIDQWAPGFLKHDLKTNYFIDLLQVLFIFGYTPEKVYIDTSLLKGKMSMFKDPMDWINYVKLCSKENSDKNIKNIKMSKDNIIYFEDEDWILYQPTTYESMNIVQFPYWCTIVRKIYEDHVDIGRFWIILFNKKIKKNSFIVEFATGLYNNTHKTKFTLHDYKDRVLWVSDSQKNKTELEIFRDQKFWSTGEEMNNSEKRIVKIFLELYAENKIKNLTKYAPKVKEIDLNESAKYEKHGHKRSKTGSIDWFFHNYEHGYKHCSNDYDIKHLIIDDKIKHGINKKYAIGHGYKRKKQLFKFTKKINKSWYDLESGIKIKKREA